MIARCSHLLFMIGCVLKANSLGSAYSVVPPPRGCAGTPLDKKNVALVGGGGYLGGITFGYLQRAASLYGTGIGKVRCMGATADTATRLNRILGQNFGLAFADESVIKLTNLQSVDAIADRLKGFDAMILGTDMKMQQRSVTPGTYEKSPNDKAWEVYWDEPKGSFISFDFPEEVKKQIVHNAIEAAKMARIQHIVVVDTDGSILPLVQNTGVPYTCVLQPDQLSDTPNWTFKDGICDNVIIETANSNNDSSGSTSSTCTREDLAALCVQVLQSLPWDTSRTLSVRSSGDTQLSKMSDKRVDQQWCVNAVSLEEKLVSIS